MTPHWKISPLHPPSKQSIWCWKKREVILYSIITALRSQLPDPFQRLPEAPSLGLECTAMGKGLDRTCLVSRNDRAGHICQIFLVFPHGAKMWNACEAVSGITSCGHQVPGWPLSPNPTLPLKSAKKDTHPQKSHFYTCVFQENFIKQNKWHICFLSLWISVFLSNGKIIMKVDVSVSHCAKKGFLTIVFYFIWGLDLIQDVLKD